MEKRGREKFPALVGSVTHVTSLLFLPCVAVACSYFILVLLYQFLFSKSVRTQLCRAEHHSFHLVISLTWIIYCLFLLTSLVSIFFLLLLLP